MKILPIIAVFSLGLTSCNLYRNYSRPDGLPTDSLFNDSTMMCADSLSSLGALPWHDMFADQALRSLITEGLQSNTDLQIALLCIDEAKAGLMASKLAYLPSLTFSPNGAITSVDGNKATKTYQIPVELS